MNRDEISLKVLTDWSARGYKIEGQKMASLQVLINTALDQCKNETRQEYDALIKDLNHQIDGFKEAVESILALQRHACAVAVNECVVQKYLLISRHDAVNACLNAKL